MLVYERLVFAAAVFDCLGSVTFSIDASKSFSPQLSITSNCFELLDFCWTLYGVGGISEIREDVWNWYITGQGNILFMLNNFLPYLIITQYEAEVMIGYLESRKRGESYNEFELRCVLEIVKPTSKTAKYAKEKLEWLERE